MAMDITPQALLDLARDKGVTIATAESCTAGGIAQRLTDLAGASSVFMGGLVTYSNAAKIALLGVSAQSLADYGAVSEPVALEMAEGALERLKDANMSIAVTGIAGPGGSEHKPEGRVCFATSYKGKTRSQTFDFGALGRAEVREAATAQALSLLAERISKDG